LVNLGKYPLGPQKDLPTPTYDLYVAFTSMSMEYKNEAEIYADYDHVYNMTIKHLLRTKVDLRILAEYGEALHRAKLRYLMKLKPSKYSAWREYVED